MTSTTVFSGMRTKHCPHRRVSGCWAGQSVAYNYLTWMQQLV